jgi:alpha-tubulin suppressor-like RCC1 family protein
MGNNQRGQLGDGTTTTDRHIPVRVHLPAGTRVTAVSAGAIFSLALTSTGRVLAWGLNHRGQLRIGVRTDRHHPVPVKLPKGTRVTGIAAGYAFGLAVTASGQGLAWGMNDFGQLGIPLTTAQSNVPVRMRLPAQDKVTAISGGFIHSLALTRAGHVLARGVEIIAPRHGVKLPAGLIATALATGSTALAAFVSQAQPLAWQRADAPN